MALTKSRGERIFFLGDGDKRDVVGQETPGQDFNFKPLGLPVPPDRDFRFASTQGPKDIHGGNPGTSPGQSRYAGLRTPSSGQ